MTNKEKYQLVCDQDTSIPIFSQAWWLNTIVGENNWDVCLVEKGGQIIATMPYCINKRYGFTLLFQPPLTQTIGPWLYPSDAKYANRLGQEKDLLNALIDQLPIFDHFHQNWHYINTNWLPFYWRGFQQTTRYTYRLVDLSDIDQVWKGFRENIRGDIRKAKSRFKVTVRTDLSIDDFLTINAKTFERQGINLPYTKPFIQRIDTACMANNARKIFIAEDEQGRHHAGVYIIWDEQNAYYLMGGGDPELRDSGATSLCMWEAIQFAATVTKSFDFEGSMIESVERFFRAFGATQTPYFSITRTSSKIIKIYRCIQDIIKK